VEKVQFLKIKYLIIILFLVISANNSNAKTSETYEYRCFVHSDYSLDKVYKYTFKKKVDKLNTLEKVSAVGVSTLASLGLLSSEATISDLHKKRTELHKKRIELRNKRYAEVDELRRDLNQELTNIEDNDLLIQKQKIKQLKIEKREIEIKLLQADGFDINLGKQIKSELNLKNKQIKYELSKKHTTRYNVKRVELQVKFKIQINQLRSKLRAKQRLQERKIKLKIRKLKLKIRTLKLKGGKVGKVGKGGKVGKTALFLGGTVLLTAGTAGVYALSRDKFNHKKYCKEESFKDTEVAKESRSKHNAKYPDQYITEIMCEYKATKLISRSKYWKRCN
jgi:hypothetical protein